MVEVVPHIANLEQETTGELPLNVEIPLIVGGRNAALIKRNQLNVFGICQGECVTRKPVLQEHRWHGRARIFIDDNTIGRIFFQRRHAADGDDVGIKDSIASTHNRFISQAVRESEAGGELMVVNILQRPGCNAASIRPSRDQMRRADVGVGIHLEVGDRVVYVDCGRREFVSQAEIEGEVTIHFPVVLDKQV